MNTDKPAEPLLPIIHSIVTRIPARVFEREGVLIYSKVDDANVDLTEQNCEGYIIHTSSYFEPRSILTRPDTVKAPVLERAREIARQMQSMLGFPHQSIMFGTDNMIEDSAAEKVVMFLAAALRSPSGDTQPQRDGEWVEDRNAIALVLAQEWADADNEAQSHCGSYGTGTAADFMPASLEHIDRIRARHQSPAIDTPDTQPQTGLADE